MNRLITTMAAACFALTAASAFAQMPSREGGEHHRMMKPCSQEADPAKCEAMRKQMHETMKQARESCKNAPDRRACMTTTFCSKSPDPAKCQAQAKERHARMGGRMDRMQEMAEACNGKRGDELRKCYREQHEKHEKSEHRDHKG